MTPIPGSDRKTPHAVFVGAEVPATEQITVTLRLRPKTPLTDEKLTHAEYEAAHGADPNDMAEVRDFAFQSGLSVSGEDAASRTMLLTGPRDAITSAFATKLFWHIPSAGGANPYRGRTGPVFVPDNLAGKVEAVLGLSDVPVAQPRFKRAVGMSMHASASYTPPQAAAAYQLPKVTTVRPQKIAVISLGGGYVQSTQVSYFSSIGQPVPIITPVSVDGAVNAPGNEADVENNLDIQVSAGIYCAMTGQPASVFFVSCPNTDAGFLDGITYAIHTLQVDEVTISWGSPESNWSGQAMAAMNSAFQAAKMLSIAITAASGDNGSGDGLPGFNTDFPSSSPYLLACGGTTKTQTAEVGWSGSGGGYSANFAKPPAQTLIQGSKRGVPDVSGIADPATGWVISDGVIGGTSAVAPMWAGIVAGFNSSLPQNIPDVQLMLYGNTACLSDVTSGSNGGYQSRPGWDEVTGLGVPNGVTLAQVIAGSQPPNPPPIPIPPSPPPISTLKLVTPTGLPHGTFAMQIGRHRYSLTIPQDIPAGLYGLTLAGSHTDGGDIITASDTFTLLQSEDEQVFPGAGT